MEAFLFGESYLVAFLVAIGLAALVDFASVFWVVEFSDISWVAVPSFEDAFGVAGLIVGFAVVAAKPAEVPAIIEPATRSVTRTFFMVFLFGLDKEKIGWSDCKTPSFRSV